MCVSSRNSSPPHYWEKDKRAIQEAHVGREDATVHLRDNEIKRHFHLIALNWKICPQVTLEYGYLMQLTLIRMNSGRHLVAQQAETILRPPPCSFVCRRN